VATHEAILSNDYSYCDCCSRDYDSWRIYYDDDGGWKDDEDANVPFLWVECCYYFARCEHPRSSSLVNWHDDDDGDDGDL